MSQTVQKLTPMYEQYLSIKQDYPDALLFYRMGDFYELFFEDAEVAARELQLTLTSRSKDEGGVPMCGVPWHSADAYISQLVDKGYRVAVCDQIEDPRTAKGLVKRAVTRVVTAGTTLEDANLEAKTHTYLGAVFRNSESGVGAFAWVDVSTGFWSGVQVGKQQDLWQWVLKKAPRELLVPEQEEIPASLGLYADIQVVHVPFRSHFEPRQALARVLATQGVAEAAALGLERRPELIQACGALVAYLERVQKCDPLHLAPFCPLDTGRHLVLDELTERNLELFRRLDGRKGTGTLWQVLDHSLTPMGGRLLGERLHAPWRNLNTILEHQEAVAFFHDLPHVRDALRKALAKVLDVERLSTRITLNRCQPRDLAALRESLLMLPAVRTSLTLPEQDGEPLSRPLPSDEELRGDFLPPPLLHLVQQWDDMGDVADLLSRALVDDPPIQVSEGGLFRPGYNAELDELLDLVEHGEARLQALLQEEQIGLPRLKLGYNRVFGYYFELSKAHRDAGIPSHFQRRQTLANADRFTTDKLKELEERLLSAADSRKSLEYRLYQDLRQHLTRMRPRMVFMADLLAQLDCWQSLAEAAARYHWTRPQLDESQDMTVRDGRHPVVEAVIGPTSFIPNDLHMDEKRRLLLITGPNMAGKSTVLRQTALMCILAQMGSFVPATEARIGLVDRIFSRVGASDNLAQGQSTFMVEMMETARILRQAGKRSLVILDEIGRGTSTFDGLALAWAVVEELARRGDGNIRTLFATHYHELTVLEGTIPGVHNMNIAIREWNGDIVFLRRLIPGPADRSYGIEVARLAGVPSSVVQRAREILTRLESSRNATAPPSVERQYLPGLTPKAVPPPEPTPAPPHPLLVALRDLKPDSLTPLEALKVLSEWKNLWGNGEHSNHKGSADETP